MTWRWTRTLVVGVLLASTGFAVAVGFTESALRLVYRWRTGYWWGANESPPMFVADPEVGWRLRPSLHGRLVSSEYSTAVHLDERAFRVAGPSRSGERADVRIAMVGDSFTFGWGVEAAESFSTLLGGLIRTVTPSRPAEIINLGVPNFGLPQEARLLDRWLPELHPTLVIVSTYLYDWDVTDVAGFVVVGFRLKRWLRLHSLAYFASVTTVKQSHAIRRLLVALGVSERQAVAFTAFDRNRSAAGRDAVRAQTFAAIERIAELTN